MGAKKKRGGGRHNAPSFISNPDWAMKYLGEQDMAVVQKRFNEEAADERPGSSHSQHRLNYLKNNLAEARRDAIDLKKHRQVLVDEYTKAHYKVEEGERMVRVSAKDRPQGPRGEMMKALVENTFASGMRSDIVDGQMVSTLREKHLTGEAVIEAPGMPRRKLTLLSNPLMAARVPYNDTQESAMPTLLSTAYASATARSGAQPTGTIAEREGKKFRSLSRFLTADKSKYLNDTAFTVALERMMKRAKQIDSRQASQRSRFGATA